MAQDNSVGPTVPDTYRIRGFLKHPDFRHGRNPLTGTEGYPVLYEARKKIQTLIHSRPVKPMFPTRKSDFELVYGQDTKESRDGDYRRRVTDIRRKSSDTVIKEQRFRSEQSNYLRAHNDYQREKGQVHRQVEKEYSDNLHEYKPFGRPGGGAPSNTTRRTKTLDEINGTDTTKYPQSVLPHKYETEIFRHRNRYDEKAVPISKGETGTRYLQELQDAANVRNLRKQQDQNAPNGISEDFFGNFGKPGGGAPRHMQTKVTQKLQGRFHSDEVVTDNVVNAFGHGCGNPKFDGDSEPSNYKQKMVMPKEEDMSKVGERGHHNRNLPRKNRVTKKVTGEAPSVIEMMAYGKDSGRSVKGSGSNPLHLQVPRYSKERIPPWDKKD